MKQLKCQDLRGGDVMLKVNDGSIFARIITLAERTVGQTNPLIMHAGIMFDRTYIVEALNDGISGSDLRVQNRGFGYMVYRPSAGNLADGAATCAKMMFDINQTSKTLKYNIPGLPGAVLGGKGKSKDASAMDNLLDDILKGKGHRFFCSQFVVYVYQFVAAQSGFSASQMFNVNDARVSPSTLASLLQRNPWFQEAGYVMPNER
jgi:hypothetical protein